MSVKDGHVPTLSAPPLPDRPLFVYGMLQPGQLAHRLIKAYVIRTTPGVVAGCLRLRDGLPLLDQTGLGDVEGHLIYLDPVQAPEAWRVVAEFEPDKHYRYEAADVEAAGEHVRANVLVGRQLGRGVGQEAVRSWSAAWDPAFTEGLAEVMAMTVETARGGVLSQPDGQSYWQVFFRLQAAYLLLWSIVERYTALRYGPRLEPGERIKRLGEDPGFRAAVVGVGAVGFSVIDARDPSDRITIRSSGDRAAEFFYQVRSNLSHRGKSAFRDGQLVFEALVHLHDGIRQLLVDEVPGLAEEWARREPTGWRLQERVTTSTDPTR